jgi:hypothetical protein
MSLFAYAADGHTLVLGDGAELLVHDGETEAPRWRADTGGRLVGVGANAIAVLSLDAEGTLRVWSHEQATAVRTHSLGVTPTALVHDDDGNVGALHAGGVVVLADGAPRAIAVDAPTAAAFGAGGELLIGTRDGTLHRYDATGAPAGTAQVPGPVRAIAWNAGGFFAVVNGAAIHRVTGLEVAYVTRFPDEDPIVSIACSPRGDRIGVQGGPHLACVLSYPARETVGHVEYPERTITGIAFGPAPYFGVGLAGGDGNKIDLTTGDLHRTDTHPGRPHNRWLVMNAFRPGRAAAPEAPPTPAPTPAPAPPAGPSMAVLAIITLVVLAAVAVIVLFT